jgi:hypothetical protein
LPFALISVVMLVLVALASVLVLALRNAAARPRSTPVPTWDCGFAAPTARMQYSASSLGDTLVRLFAFVLRPREARERPHGALPSRSSYASHVDDPVLSRLGYPLANGLAARFVALRQHQTGRIQGYILYVVGTTLVLLLVVLPVLDVVKELVRR